MSEEVGSHGSGGPLEWSSSIDGRPKQLVSPLPNLYIGIFRSAHRSMVADAGKPNGLY